MVNLGFTLFLGNKSLNPPPPPQHKYCKHKDPNKQSEPANYLKCFSDH